MFRDNEKAQLAIYNAIIGSSERLGPLGAMPLAPLAAEACGHMDKQDECSVTVRCSKEHGIQYAYTGCPTHAMVLLTMLALHHQKIFDEKIVAHLNDEQKLHAKLLLAQIGIIADMVTNNDPLLQNIKPKKKGE